MRADTKRNDAGDAEDLEAEDLYDTVLVRYGEIGNKSSSVRSRLQRLLADRIRLTLDDREIEYNGIEVEWGRLFVDCDNVVDAAEAVADVFGVVRTSPAVRVDPEMDEMENAAVSLVKAVGFDSGKFAVRPRSAGDHSFDSEDMGRKIGDAVWEAVEEPEVDLDDPELSVGVEAREDAAYVYVEEMEGVGGLPVGSQGRTVGLVSGGIDSPVAAWYSLRRGSSLVPIYLDLDPLVGEDHFERARLAVEALSRYAPDVDEIWRVPTDGILLQLFDEVERDRMIIYRRIMLRIAEAIAKKEDAEGIVTGESLGQKSSQTARNLRVTSEAVGMPVHRPLFGRDKTEITAKAREIGTYPTVDIDEGCASLAPHHPTTHADLEDVREKEVGLSRDVEKLVLDAVERSEKVRVRRD
ncbi:MAG: tRNA uracil 4-sulfurtransferase ThiI [Halobacteria archaeon]|nr:tRNA uracil 4-sulfurtransferase ThiI [Halobacteria archaeon]